ncbi:MAG: tetratricopeptide repeat protein [Ramlibacter sp.]|jgi:Tfp pilus assembly protein PilF|nr:tetratricopeptide repeat protein [Ramlibacter sp.]
MTDNKPNPARAAELYGQALQAFQAQQSAASEALARQALLADPDLPDALELLGAIYAAREERAFALPFFERAVKLAPHMAQFHYNLGVIHHELNRFPQAMRSYHQALRLQPEHPAALSNYGDLLRRHDQLDAAREHLERLFKIDPEAKGLALKLALTYFGLKEYTLADHWFLEALKDPKEPAVVHWEYAHYLLLQKRFAEGWASYEWRAQCSKFNSVYHFPHTQPQWNGESLRGKTLLVHREQGLGDEIMFGAMLAEAARDAQRVVLVAAPEMVRLWKTSLPDKVHVYPYWGALPPEWNNPPLPRWFEDYQIDYQMAIGRLAHLFRPSLESFGTPVPYLKVDEGLKAEWKAKVDAIPNIAGKKKVGVMWGANPAAFHYDASRRALRKSVPLQELEPLSGLKGVQLISLANNVHGSQAGSLNALDLIDFSEDLIDLAETAALMLQLDLIITIDTSLAHLAGALGCKVWVPLCWDADWRWGVDDETSYWYPDVRLFRQTRPGDWKPVIKAIAKDLKAHAKAA